MDGGERFRELLQSVKDTVVRPREANSFDSCSGQWLAYHTTSALVQLWDHSSISLAVWVPFQGNFSTAKLCVIRRSSTRKICTI